ncbi:MAG: PIG-L family deacetylase, partial [Spirochaetales bacterium]|nr:PIG-L family deacetylase [Candidatus Physcosoma equi]
MDFSLIQSLMAPPSLRGLKKVLCVQPHPDDNEIGMGGIICSLVEQGTQVDYLTVTDGSLGDLGLVKGNLKEVREGEAKASASHLGVTETYFLGYEDGTLENVVELAGRIATVLREGQYDGIAAPDPWNTYEAHHDHVVTGLA